MRTRVIVIFIALLVAAGAVARADRSEGVPLRASFDTFPMQMGEWRGVQQPPFTEAVLKVLGLNDYITRSYYSAAGPGVGLYVGYWQSQKQGDTIHSPQNCLPGAGWEPVQQAIVAIPDPRTPGAVMPVNRTVIQKGLERQLVLYWYQSHDRVVASEYWAKFYLVADAMRLNRTDGALVRIIAPVTGDGPDAVTKADQLAMRFVNDLMPQLETFLPR